MARRNPEALRAAHPVQVAVLGGGPVCQPLQALRGDVRAGICNSRLAKDDQARRSGRGGALAAAEGLKANARGEELSGRGDKGKGLESEREKERTVIRLPRRQPSPLDTMAACAQTRVPGARCSIHALALFHSVSRNSSVDTSPRCTLAISTVVLCLVRISAAGVT